MQVFQTPNGGLIKAWVDGVPFEDAARKQVENIASMPFIHSHVAVMPDVHYGKGATIGSVIATSGAIIPAAVGVDLGCGMLAVRTELKASDLPDDLSELRSNIESQVPVGRTDNGGANDRGSWGDAMAAPAVWHRYAQELRDEYEEIVADHPRAGHRRVPNMLGTLGTGNHFAEVCLDETQTVWILLHSGSRGPGASIGNYFIELAKKDMQRYFVNLPDKDLAYLVEGTENFHAYKRAIRWAQKYARVNREVMKDSILRAFAMTGLFIFGEEVVANCHHNYVNEEKHFGKKVYVTRKGAVRARVGDVGIIPGSMGAKSYIVEGLGNRDSFETCSHGAGRQMSRRKAREQITEAEHQAATTGVECIKSGDQREGSILEESPRAYKDIDAVMAAQSDLVRVKHTLKQVLCVKG